MSLCHCTTENLFSPSNSSILKPDFDLRLWETKLWGDVNPLCTSNVLLYLKVSLQSLELLRRKHSAHASWFLLWSCTWRAIEKKLLFFSSYLLFFVLLLTNTEKWLNSVGHHIGPFLRSFFVHRGQNESNERFLVWPKYARKWPESFRRFLERHHQISFLDDFGRTLKQPENCVPL